MKKPKKILLILLTLCLSIFFINEVNAATSATIGVKTSSSLVQVGNTFKVTVVVSSSSPIGAWEYTLNYDTSLVSLTNSTVSAHYADSAANSSTKTKSYVYTFKAKKKGYAKFSISSASVIGWNDEVFKTTAGAKTITIKTREEIEASYSTNNNLSNLAIKGYVLTPAFDPNTLEYTLNVNYDVKELTINATKEDSKSSISGSGTKILVEGSNNIEIVVTSQKGTTKTYKILVNVLELNPIKVTIDKKEYSIVKQKESLIPPSFFKETTITYSNEEIPALYSDVTDYTLVGLKNSDGEIFLYRIEDDTFTLYNELIFNKVSIIPLNTDETPNNYYKSTMYINEKEIPIYKNNKISDYVLIYGMNNETGEKHYYQYDKEEKTIQRLNEDLINNLSQEKDLYLYIAILFGIGLVLSILVSLSSIKKVKKVKKYLKEKKESIITSKEEPKPKEEMNKTKKLNIENKKSKK